jgi:hypothetical protein
MKMRKIILYLSPILAWSFLCLAPWQAWLGGNLWIRLGIALFVLVVPGGLLYLLLAREQHFADFFLFGLVLSHLMLALLGTAARSFHFSFETIRSGFLLLGLVLLIPFLRMRWLEANGLALHGVKWRRVAVWSMLLVLMVSVSLMTIGRVLSDDDLTYLAFVTKFQRMPALDFRDVFFGAEQLTMTRMWLVSSPFSQAFLADMSGMHAIFLFAGYYEPFLAIAACLALYRLARGLGVSSPTAVFSVAAQFVVLALLSEYLQPGAPFFRQLGTDKASAAFIFVPVFILSLSKYLSRPGRRPAILCLLTGLSLSLMHPVIGSFGVIIAIGMALFSITKDNARSHMLIALLCFLILSPYVVIRFFPTASQTEIPYEAPTASNSEGIESMIMMWGEGPFYGLNPAAWRLPVPDWGGASWLGNLLALGWIIVPVSGAILSAKHLRTSLLSQYIFSSLLLCLAAAFPLTGWLIGRIFSVWMLERTTWLYPFGLSLAYLLPVEVGRGAVLKYSPSGKRMLSSSPGLLAGCLSGLCLISLFAIMRAQDMPDIGRLQQRTARYRQLAAIGDRLDHTLAFPGVVVASDDLNDLLPGLSWKAKALTFRPSDQYYPYFYTAEERSKMLIDRHAIFNQETTVEDRRTLIDNYDVKAMVATSEEYDIFKPLVKVFPEEFESTHVGRYYVITRH